MFSVTQLCICIVFFLHGTTGVLRTLHRGKGIGQTNVISLLACTRVCVCVRL